MTRQAVLCGQPDAIRRRTGLLRSHPAQCQATVIMRDRTAESPETGWFQGSPLSASAAARLAALRYPVETCGEAVGIGKESARTSMRRDPPLQKRQERLSL